MTTATARAPATGPLTEDVLRTALSGRIDPVRAPLAYRTGLLLVAVATVLLPVAYLAVAALAAWVVALHAMHNTWILAGSVLFLRAIAYLGPIAAGVVVVLFLFKPLLARPASPRSDVEIDAGGFPLVFALVEGISRAVGAPTPSRITVDCEVNASASFRRGLASFFGRDLQLTIGLPLATSLTLRQLAGVLGHEMGHFAQGSAMRLTYLIRSVNGWLARVVYERDEWDETLSEWSRESDWRIAAVMWLARVGVWVSRKVLWLLMIVGHAIGMLMLRQMEFDADRYEARLAGSDTFASTALAMRALAVSSMKATAALAQSYGERRLADDFPALVAATRETLPPDVRRRVEELDSSGRRARVFDTHPPDSARIQKARDESAAGLFQLEGSAAQLFSDLPGLCRRATEAFYREHHEIELAGVKLEPASEVLARQNAVERGQEAADRLFGPLASVTQPLGLPEELPSTPIEVAEAVETLRASRDTLARRADVTRASGKTLREARAEALELSSVAEVLAAGFQPTQGGGAGLDTAGDAERRARLARERAEASEVELGPVRTAARESVRAALSLLRTPEVRADLGGDTSAEAAARMLDTLAVLGRQAPSLQNMMEEHQAIAALMSVGPTGDDEVQRCLKHVSPKLHALRKRLDALLLALEPTPYPFEHATGPVSLAAVVTDGLPPDENELSAFFQAGHVLARVSDVHARVHGRLATIVEDVERAVGVAQEQQ